MHATQSTLPPGPAPAIADLSLIRSPETRAGRKALDRGDWPAVRKFCLQRLTRDDSDAFAHRYLGTALAALGDLEQAREAFDQALAVYPNDPVVLVNGADLAARQMDHDRAYELSKRATVAAPSIVKGWVILLSACYLTGRHEEAIEAAATVLAMPMDNKSRQVATNNLAINLRDLGRMDEAMAAVREAIRLDPTWTVPYMNQLLFMLSMPDVTAMDMQQVAREFAMQSEDPYKASWPRFENHNADPHRRLRVGFLSPDFNAHSVMYFVEGLLPHLDRNQFEVVALYLQSADHRVTQRVRHHCDEFHALHGLDDGTLFERLKALDIDILIDLAGHTAASGLGAMARKPAPVQATWLGFPATTGLTAIDWRITDSCTDLPGADAEYTERLWRLDDIFCAYRPMSRFPLYRYHPDYCVRPTPALDAGHITFGSCNNLSKLTDEVLQTWARLLQAVPNSRLLVEGKGFESDTTRNDFTRRFVGLGGDAGQLELIPRRSDQQYLTYHRIDIALDPFPLTGGTTSFDLLWMGVPMVTMQGDSFRSRMGVTIARVLGHDDWVAHDRQDYIAIAARMAADLPALNRQRLAQRLRMERSPLMDEALFAHRFGTALRQMWYGWCARRRTADTREQDALIQTWSTHPWPAPRQVTIGPGQVISLQQAHQRLQALTDEALRLAPREQLLAGCTEPPEVTHEAWFKVLDWCEYLLDSIPKEPLALATLAELEHAHGRTAYAATYLHYAQESLSSP